MIFAASLFAITFSACSDDGDDNNDVAVTGITLSESSITLVAGGETATLTATVTPDNATNKTVTWTSSDKSVATVEDGVVTPVAEGTATITAKAGEQTAECAVTVNPEGTIIPVTKVELNKTSLTLNEEASETLTATVKPENATNKTVTWSSDKTDVATVDSNGKVTAVAEGTATITAKAGEQTATCAVTVVAKDADIVAVTGITLDKTTLSLEEGDEETLTATVLPATATNKTVTWTSSDTGVATVENGKVKAVAAGNATITAKAGEQTAECAVTVTAASTENPPVTDPENPPSGDDGDKSKSMTLNVGDLDVGDITETKTVGDFTFVIDSSSNKLSVEANEKTVDGIKYANRLKTNGTGSKAKRAVKFSPTGPATIVIIAQSGSGTADRDFAIANDSGVLFTGTALGASASAITFDYKGNGEDLYLYSTDSGINFYAIYVNSYEK